MSRRKPRSPHTPPDAAFLPEAELEVLAGLHRLGEAETAEIRTHLAPQRPMTHASVATLLRRLEGRGLVGRRKSEVGKSYVYFAIEDAEQTYRSVVERVAERVFDDDRIGLVSALFGGKPPDARELAELQRLVEKLEKQR